MSAHISAGYNPAIECVVMNLPTSDVDMILAWLDGLSDLPESVRALYEELGRAFEDVEQWS